MIRKVTLAAGLAITLVAGGVRLTGAQCPPSKCDAGVTKPAGRKTACKTGVIAKGQAKAIPPDPAKLAACGTKFMAACAKAKSAGGCCVQTQSCADIESEADDCAASLSGSPSGAFLN